MALMVSIFTGIMLTYVNVLNMLSFIIRCFTYVYSKYVLNQLYTVLIIPRDFSFLHQQQEEMEARQNGRWPSEVDVLNLESEDEENSRLIDNNYVPEALQNEGLSDDDHLIEVNYVRN